MKKRVSQRDVAQAAGVDVSTVSLALRGHPRIPADTKRRLQALARQMGYQPDPAIASIAASRWHGRRGGRGIMLAFLADARADREPELALCERGVRAQSALLGYGVSVFYREDFPSPESFWRVVRARGMRGAIIGQSRSEVPPGFFDESLVPVVHCGFLREVNADTVCPDLRLAAKQACLHALRRHGRLTCFLPVEKELASDHTILGTVEALRAELSPRQIRLVVTRAQPGPADFRRLSQGAPPAFVVINERHAALLRARVPRARAATVYTLHTLPPFAGKRGMDLCLETVGRMSVNLLEMKIRHLPLSSDDFRQSLLVRPRWLEGGDSGADALVGAGRGAPEGRVLP